MLGSERIMSKLMPKHMQLIEDNREVFGCEDRSVNKYNMHRKACPGRGRISSITSKIVADRGCTYELARTPRRGLRCIRFVYYMLEFQCPSLMMRFTSNACYEMSRKRVWELWNGGQARTNGWTRHSIKLMFNNTSHAWTCWQGRDLGDFHLKASTWRCS